MVDNKDISLPPRDVTERLAVKPIELLHIRNGWRYEELDAPEMEGAFSIFIKKMEDLDYSKEDLEEFEKEFRKGCLAIRKVYERGGYFAGFNFEECDLSSHTWKHIKADLVSVLEIMPGFIKKEDEELKGKREIWKVKAMLWGTLLHDLFYLMTDEARREGYQSSGELFFDHCEKSAENSEKVLRFMEANLEIDLHKQGLDEHDWFKYIENLIRMTEFNRLRDEEEMLRKFFGDDFEFARIVQAIDLLSYFEDPRQIPWGAAALWKEHQAKMLPIGRTGQFLEEQKEKLAENFPAIKEKFEQERLLVAEAKFPGQGFLDFVASDFLFFAEEFFNLKPYVDCADFFYEGRENRVREGWEMNKQRILALKDFLEIGERKEALAYFEGGLSGSQLEEVFLGFPKEWLDPNEEWREQFPDFDPVNSTFWADVDRRMLTRRGRLKRLATGEIKALLLTVKEDYRTEALAALLERFKENVASGDRNVTLFLRIAPEAYKGILTNEQIVEAFRKVDGLEMIYCVRRDEENEVTPEKSKEIVKMFKERQIKGVSFAGNEYGKLSDHKNFLNILIENDVPLLIQAGQVFTRSDFSETKAINLAYENMTYALQLAEEAKRDEHQLIALEGFQRLPEIFKWVGTRDKYGEEKRREIVERLVEAAIPLIVSPIYDREMGFEKNMAVVTSRIAKELERNLRMGVSLGNPLFSGGAALATELLALTIETAEAQREFLEPWSKDEYIKKMKQCLIGARQANIFGSQPQTST